MLHTWIAFQGIEVEVEDGWSLFVSSNPSQGGRAVGVFFTALGAPPAATGIVQTPA